VDGDVDGSTGCGVAAVGAVVWKTLLKVISGMEVIGELGLGYFLAGSSVECISSSKVSTFDRRQLT
jgi:hypothetical protein